MPVLPAPVQFSPHLCVGYARGPYLNPAICLR
jgi:hypothetical protein